MDCNLFDDVIQLSNLKKDDEIEKLYIPEEYNDKEWVSYIVKRGFDIQKMAMINKIPFMNKDSDLIEYTIQSIIDYIEIWDDSLQICFANSIYLTYSNNENNHNVNMKIYKIMNKIVNTLIKFCMKIISTEVNSISDEYLKAFDSIVRFYSKYEKIKIDSDCMDYACNMGLFGKNLTSRRFSVYFCSSLIQISVEFYPELYNRLMILASDCDKTVNLEVAYNFRFIFREYLEDNFIKNNLLKTIKPFFFHMDLLHSTEVFISVLLNLNRINDDSFIQIIIQNISNLLENSLNNNFNTNDFIHIIKLFEAMVVELSNVNIQKQSYSRALFNLKQLFNKDIRSHSTPHLFNVLIEKFPNIYTVFTYFGEGLSISEILSFIFKNFSIYNHLFIQNFDVILKTIDIEDSLSIRLCNLKFYQIIEEKDKTITSIIVKNFIKILPHTMKNEEFISIFHSKYEIFEDHLKLSIKRGWQETFYFLKSFMKCDVIYDNSEFLKRLNQLIMNFVLIYIENDLTIDENIYINYKIAKICLRTFAYIIRYAHQTLKTEILRFIDKEILEAKSIYIRRLYLCFYKKCVKIFSINSLKQLGILETSFKFFDECILVIPEYIYIIIKIYPLFSDEEKLKIFNKLENLKKIYITMPGDDDKEVDRDTIIAINELDKCILNYIKKVEDYSFIILNDQERLKIENKLSARESNLNHEKNSNSMNNIKANKVPIIQTSTKKTNHSSIIKIPIENSFKKVNSICTNSLNLINKKISAGITNINLNHSSFSAAKPSVNTRPKKNLDEKISITKEVKSNEISQEKAKIILNPSSSRSLKKNVNSNNANTNSTSNANTTNPITTNPNNTNIIQNNSFINKKK